MTTTLMRREIEEIPAVLERQIKDGLAQYLDAGRQAAASNPRGFITCARGTSDHATTFFKYVMELRTGLPVASIGPSVASVYDAPLRLQDFICLTISQSGGSPDLLALQKRAKQGGTRTIALLNVIDSPVGAEVQTLLPILAGPEKAVAATKSFVGSLFAILGFVAGFTADEKLEKALRTCPDLARRALECDWPSAAMPLARARSVLTIGRGPGLAIAAEAALKLKETCRIHAEAFSAAEVLHGPVALAQPGLAALVFHATDKSKDSVRAAVSALASHGTTVFTTDSGSSSGAHLKIPVDVDNLILPLLQITAFYKFVEALAGGLGENADAPVGLQKVTETI